MGWQDAPEVSGNAAWMQAPEVGNGPQPSFMDRVIASPVGRLAHNLTFPLGNMEVSAISSLAKGSPADAPIWKVINGLKSIGDSAEAGYQGALQNNRNTPGYAAERAKADQAMAMARPGFTDQMSAPVNAPIAGTVGLMGGLDSSNAMADAQTSAQQAYAQQNPVKSAIGQTVGGLALGKPAIADAPVLRPALKPMVKSATDAGYVLPPRMISEDVGPVTSGLEAWSGKVKTAQAASEKNQEVTNNLAKQAIGIPADEDITAAKIKQIRSSAGQVKQHIEQTVPDIHTDPQFAQDVVNLSGIRSSVAQNFPNIAKNQSIEDLVSDLSNAKAIPTKDAFDVVQRLRQNANANFNAFQDADKLALGQAQRQAANHIEDLIERNLLRNGYTGIQDFKDARQLLAKTYDVEGATNLATGNVSAQKIAALQNKGRPLTGELKTIADVHSAFPKAMQPLDRMGATEGLSTLDMGAAALSAAHGNYGVAGALLGKPLARGAVLSNRVQGRLTNQLPLNLPRLGNNQVSTLNLTGAGLGVPLMPQRQ